MSKFREGTTLISRNQPQVAEECTQWLLTQLLQPVEQTIQTGVTLQSKVSGNFKD